MEKWRGGEVEEWSSLGVEKWRGGEVQEIKSERVRV